VTAHSSLRDEVAAQLAALSAPGQPLNTAAETSTWIRYAGDPLRASMRKTIIRRYLDRESPQCEGRSAILTAGPPGAGKTNMLRSQVPDLASYRILDADIVKDYLIEAAVGDGIYDDLLAYELPDRHTIAPRELAALVHDESTNLINEIRKHCVEQRENIIVEGTLKWPDQGPDVFSQLADAYYSSVEVLGIEVDPDTAHRQALSRWWSGRTRWVAGTDTLGGRFTPPDAIDGCYPTPHTADALSHCGDHALQLIDLAQSGVIPSVKITIFRPSAAGSLEPTVEKAYLQQPGPPS